MQARQRAIAFDSSVVDTTWECCQERAAMALRGGDSTQALSGWIRGANIARRHFERGDPRIATSLTNRAYGLRRQNQLVAARESFKDALVAWDETWRWVPLMKPPRQPEESIGGGYSESARKQCYAIIRQGRQITEAIEREQRLPQAGLEKWRAYRPPRMSDMRRLMSAIFLIASLDA